MSVVCPSDIRDEYICISKTDFFHKLCSVMTATPSGPGGTQFRSRPLSAVLSLGNV
jgi:hypothetical protein